MNCKEIRRKLPDYFNNKLSGRKIEIFQKHFDSCTECTNLYSSLNNTLALLKPNVEIPEQAFYFTRLKQKMENKSSIKGFSFIEFISKKAVQPIIYLASLIIAVYIGILIGSSPTTKSQYTELNDNDKDYIQTYAEYQYLNDLDIETIENLLIEDNDLIEE